ncbi:MAG TPA: adenylate/guanylate cyclase domain-containing protein [Methylomirabilota bacterium]
MLIALAVCFGTLTLRALGTLESLELSAYDWFVRLRPDAAAPDTRIALITVTEGDLQTHGWPLSDGVLAEVLQRLARLQPRAIGVDIYRDRPVPPGSERLAATLARPEGIVWVMKFGDGASGVPAPPALRDTEAVGFNDILVDPGGTVRRGLLFLDDGVRTVSSFALRLALLYLGPAGVTARADPRDERLFRLGQVTIRPLEPNDGGYVAADARGYQFLLDFRGARQSFRAFDLTALLSGKLDASALRDKIVILGVTAESVKDHFYIPHSRTLVTNQQIPGVVLHAHIASQLLHIGIDGARPTVSPPEWQKALWVLLWSALAALLAVVVRSPWRLTFGAVGGLVALTLVDGLAFANGWWLPLVPPAIAWLASAGGATSYLAYRETMERAALMQLFSKHVSKEIAEALWRHRDQFLEGGRPHSQRLVATVLFTDLMGFTSVSEKLAPEALMEWLNEYMEVMAGEISRHGGVINKYIGDSIMAMFGVPVARTGDEEIRADAVNAVQCALALESALERLNHRWRERGLATIGMRIGIFTGPMVAGSLGGADRLEYTVIGDTVNTASRLESFDKELFAHSPCRILIGEATLRYLGDRFVTERVGDATLKGKEEKIAVYRVVRAAEA